MGMSVTSASLDLCPHCFFKEQRVGWLFRHNGGVPTCEKCDRVHGQDFTEAVALANYMDVLGEAKANAESAGERAKFDTLDDILYPIYLRYEA